LHFSASQLKSRVSPCFFIFDYFFDYQQILSKLGKFSVYFFLLKYWKYDILCLLNAILFMKKCQRREQLFESA